MTSDENDPIPARYFIFQEPHRFYFVNASVFVSDDSLPLDGWSLASSGFLPGGSVFLYDRRIEDLLDQWDDVVDMEQRQLQRLAELLA